MKYAIYVKQAANQPEEFLQSSDDLSRVKKDKQTVERWLFEMGVTITYYETTKFTIYEDGVAVFRRNLVGDGSKTWVKIPV